MSTPKDLIATAPVVTAKSPVANDATPLLESVAFSAAIVNVLAASSYVVVIPSPSCTKELMRSSTLSLVKNMFVLSAKSSVSKVNEPPNSKLLPFIVTDLLSSLLFPMVPFAIIVLIIPKPLTCNASPSTSIDELSTATSNVLPDLVNASPAIT